MTAGEIASQPLRVMITAAASGIGLVIAKSFAAQGHRVQICDVDTVALTALAELAPEITGSRVDAGNEAAMDRWFETAVRDLGGLDVLVNNAGIAGPTSPVEGIDYRAWSECLRICLDSQFLTCRRAAPLLKAQRSGSIINISSTAGLFGYPLRTPYAAAKWAVIGLTKSLAAELGPWNVRANAICPGSVLGDRMTRVINAEAAMRGATPEAVRVEYTSGQSIKRFIEASEIADMCLFLASPAGKMVSGQAIAVDGHTETFHTA
jgi:NAD(P)-dependent dehydrogenase (short-subunit alcohol dehydrogenase family)